MDWSRTKTVPSVNIEDRRGEQDRRADTLLGSVPQSDAEFEAKLAKIRASEAYRRNSTRYAADLGDSDYAEKAPHEQRLLFDENLKAKLAELVIDPRGPATYQTNVELPPRPPERVPEGRYRPMSATEVDHRNGVREGRYNPTPRVELVGEDENSLVYRQRDGREIRIPKSVVRGS